MRNPFYDILKGYAIFLVVFGHVIQTFCPTWQQNSLELAILSFHMPLFIMVSGYFFLRSVDKRTIKEFIKQKFIHLMLPSITMGAISCCLIVAEKLARHKALEVWFFPQLLVTVLWFLTVLFILSCIGCIFRKYLKGWMYSGWGIFMVIIYFVPGYPLVNEIKFLTPFFVGAIFLSKYKWENIHPAIGVIALFAFFCILPYYNFSTTMYEMTNDVFSNKYFVQFLFRSVIGTVGCLGSIFICQLLQRIKYSSILAYIGGVTLPIYVLHQKLIMWNMVTNYEVNSIIGITIIAIILLCVTIAVYKVLRKNRYIALLLFGETDKVYFK